MEDLSNAMSGLGLARGGSIKANEDVTTRVLAERDAYFRSQGMPAYEPTGNTGSGERERKTLPTARLAVGRENWVDGGGPENVRACFKGPACARRVGASFALHLTPATPTPYPR